MPTPNRATPPPLVLASGSPRRRDLLGRAGIDFEVIPADIDEIEMPGEKPAEMVERLAREKALAVAARLDPADGRPVLAADTIVVLGDQKLGKPRDRAHAVELVSSLVGRTHQVATGVALARTVDRAILVDAFHVFTSVRMRGADRGEVEAYVETGESLDKAGGYALQGEGRRFVEAVEGSDTNVIGLPMDETLALLARLTDIEVGP